MHKLAYLAALLTLVSFLAAGCGSGLSGDVSGVTAGAGTGGTFTVGPPGSVVGLVEGPTSSREILAAFVASDYTASIQGTNISVPVKSDGTFRLDGVPPGGQVVSIIGSQDSTGAIIQVSVASGQTCCAGPIIPHPAGSISSSVKGPNGPVAGASIVAVPLSDTGEPLAGVGNGRACLVAFTDSQGQASFPGLPPGTYLLRAGAVGFVDASQTVAVVAGSTATASYSASNSDPGCGAMSGDAGCQGTDSSNGGDGCKGQGDMSSERSSQVDMSVAPMTNPVRNLRGALVTLVPSSSGPASSVQGGPVSVAQQTLFALSDANGHYRVNAVPPGTYTATIFKQGLTPVSQSIAIAPGQEAHFSGILTMITGTLSGTVSESIGALSNAGVVALPGDPFQPLPVDSGQPAIAPPTASGLALFPGTRSFGLTDSLGHYSMNLMPGTYSVTAFALHHQDQTQSTSITQGVTQTLDFFLSQGLPGAVATSLSASLGAQFTSPP